MINKPPVSELQKKVPCRYMLVSVIAKRARQIVAANADLDDRKAVTVAVEELMDDKLTITYPEEAAK